MRKAPYRRHSELPLHAMLCRAIASSLSKRLHKRQAYNARPEAEIVSTIRTSTSAIRYSHFVRLSFSVEDAWLRQPFVCKGLPLVRQVRILVTMWRTLARLERLEHTTMWHWFRYTNGRVAFIIVMCHSFIIVMCHWVCKDGGYTAFLIDGNQNERFSRCHLA